MTKIKMVIVHDLMQKDYIYYRTEEPGSHFHPDFNPDLTPREMLQLGVFGGKYMTDCLQEFPDDWFQQARLCHEFHDPALNCFKVNASSSLQTWRQKNWIRREDPRGWFQWYCRYYMGRRSPDDEWQIARWKAMKRHLAQFLNSPHLQGDWHFHPRQRQALLHWAYDTRFL